MKDFVAKFSQRQLKKILKILKTDPYFKDLKIEHFQSNFSELDNQYFPIRCVNQISIEKKGSLHSHPSRIRQILLDARTLSVEGPVTKAKIISIEFQSCARKKISFWTYSSTGNVFG